ncbi:MAG: hypothetical protein AAFR64_09070 [Pseudomonadota bacterium]
MTIGASSNAAIESSADDFVSADTDEFALPEAYEDIRGNGDIQFEPLQPKGMKPREPSWFEEWLADVFEWFAQIFAPFAKMLVGSWGVLQWVLLAALAGFIVFLIVRLVGPLASRRRSDASVSEAEPEWQPDREESLALLEDADRLAAEGRFDEAARLLLQRSVGQIAAARPDWVDPSSTARELAALPRLSDAARKAFRIISEAVERSLFALKALTREDWETARAAYADFALARIDGGKAAQVRAL